MKSSVEALEGNKVKLSVEIEEDEFDKDITRAFKAIAKEVKLPGFRQGKAPRKVLEARIGVGVAREQALRDAVPNYLAQAVREHDVDLVAQPQVEITDGQESGPVEFDATCEVRPVITVSGYDGLRVELPSLVVDDEALDEVRNQELSRNASLSTVDRPAAEGDTVTLDIVAVRNGEEVPGLNVEDWTYEVGQGWISETFDDEITGASAGDVLTFVATPTQTSDPADFTVTVSAVQEKVLPELTDEWVDENQAEFATVDEWTESLREQLGEVRLQQARSMINGRLSEALAELVDVDAPEAMVDGEVDQQVRQMAQQFAAQRMDLGQWLQATGQDINEFRESLREPATIAAKVDLALRAVAEAEELDVEPDDLEAEFFRMGMQHGMKTNEVRKLYEQQDAIPSLVADIRKGKAMDWLVHHIEFVDENGVVIDRDTLLGHAHDEHGNHIDADTDADPDGPDETDGEVHEAADTVDDDSSDDPQEDD